MNEMRVAYSFVTLYTGMPEFRVIHLRFLRSICKNTEGEEHQPHQ